MRTRARGSNIQDLREKLVTKLAFNPIPAGGGVNLTPPL